MQGIDSASLQQPLMQTFCETMMNTMIRKAESRDIAEIQRLYRQLDDYHVELIPKVFQSVEDNARRDDVVQKWIDRDDADYLLAILDEYVIGFVSVQQAKYPKSPMFRPQEFALIENTVVETSYRGRGVGTKLIRAAIEWASGHGLRHVQTSVWHDNVKAREFYFDHGFHPKFMRLELDTEGNTEQIN